MDLAGLLMPIATRTYHCVVTSLLEPRPSADSNTVPMSTSDKEGFELNLLKECEAELNRIAEATSTRVVVLEMAIIPRSLEYIHGEVNK